MAEKINEYFNAARYRQYFLVLGLLLFSTFCMASGAPAPIWVDSRGVEFSSANELCDTHIVNFNNSNPYLPAQLVRYDLLPDDIYSRKQCQFFSRDGYFSHTLQIAAQCPYGWHPNQSFSHLIPSQDLSACICPPGTPVYTPEYQVCTSGYSISLVGPDSTKILPAGPALLISAVVKENGGPAKDKYVTVSVPGRNAIQGQTGIDGKFNFTYIPPSRPTNAILTANCTNCLTNPITKNIKVSDFPSCRRGDAGNLVGNPIAPASGTKTQIETDWQDHGAHPLSLIRSYHSSGDQVPVGWGAYWSHNYAAQFVGGDLQRTASFGSGTLTMFNRKATNEPWINDSGEYGLTKNNLEWRITRLEDNSYWDFDSNNVLVRIGQRNGWVMQLSYTSGILSEVTNTFGRKLQFFYDAQGFLTRVTAPNGNSIDYDLHSTGRLLNVLYPDSRTKTYLYENSQYPNALTGINDESGQRYATFTYDTDGRATSTGHAGNVSTYSVSHPTLRSSDKGLVTLGSDYGSVFQSSVEATDPRGNVQTLSYQGGNGTVHLRGSSGSFDGGTVASRNFLESLNLPILETDFKGNKTSFEWDTSRRLLLKTIRAANTPLAQTVQTQWHPQFRLPTLITEVGRAVAYAYDSLGNKLSETISDTGGGISNGVARTTSWTYHASGLVATETAPNGAVTSFAYDSLSNLTSSVNALGQTEAFTHNAAGQVLTHTATTGLVTNYTYDARGRVLSMTRAGLVTTLTYRPTGQVATAAMPHGHVITYTYDAAQRLNGWSDNRGASATYTLDGMGNRVTESITDAQGQTAWKVARTINSLNRVETITAGGVGDTSASISYNYDANGDLIRSTETVSGNSTALGIDVLRRVSSITSAQNASAALEYNALDAVTKATDFKSVATNYTRDALGKAKQETSPDAGALSSTYDNLGLPQSITDAMGRAASITRDALGRPTQIVSTLGGATRTTVLRYDLPGAEYNASGAPQASIGTLSEIQDPEVTTRFQRALQGPITRFQRDLQGRITRKTQMLASSSLSIGYTYVPAGQNGAGQIASLSYPSGKQLTYAYDTTGRLTGLSWAGQPLVASLEWSPLGQPTGWQWPGFLAGPGSTAPLAEIRSYTSAGQLSGSALLDVIWDSAGRVSRIQQKHMLPGTGSGAGATAQQTTLTSVYTYNPLGRLTASAHSAPAGLALPSGWSLSDIIGPNATGYAWDVNGNRTQAHYSFTATAGTTTLQRVYQTTTGTNRLSGYTQTYQEPGSSAQATSLTYAHDASGALTKKGENHLHYGVDGRIAKVGLSADANQAAMVNYTYNLLSQRLLKRDSRLSSVTPVTEQTLYADDSMGSTVLGLYGNRRSTHSAAPAGEADSTEVIYLPTASGPMPIAAQINGRLYAIDSDHLNTPRRLTTTQGQVAWQWLITGFGEVQPTLGAKGYALNGIDNGRVYSEAVTFNLRYPGQQWDEETQLSYNLNRYYDAQSGRYIQSDPIGLEGGSNRFSYVGGNPLGAIDPQGLTTLAWCFGGPVPCAFGVGATVAAAGWGVWSSGQNMPGPTGDYSPWSPNSSDNERFVNDRDAVKELDVPPPPYQDPDKPDCDELKSRIKHYDRAIKAREILTQRWYNGVLNSGHAMRIDILKRDRDRIQRRLDRGDCKPC